MLTFKSVQIKLEHSAFPQNFLSQFAGTAGPLIVSLAIIYWDDFSTTPTPDADWKSPEDPCLS